MKVEQDRTHMAAERESSGALARAGKNLISLEIYLQHGKINHQMVLYVIAKHNVLL